MLLIAVGMSIYLTAYVWRRVDRPQLREGKQLTHSTEDWAYYYAAANAMRTGADIYTAEAPGRERAGYIYPPMLAFFYQPLAKMGLIPGARASLLIDVLAIAGALGIAARALLERFGRRPRWQVVLTLAVLGALLTSDKIKGELQMLQCNGLVALGMALGLWLLDRKPIWAGVALGFAINIKYQALGLILYLIFRKRWKALGGTVLGTAFWALLPALTVGLAKDAEYLARGFSGVLRLVGFNMGGQVANVETMTAGFSMSITSAAARFIEDHGMALSPFIPAGVVAGLWLAALAGIYRQRKMPVLAWPAAAAQKLPPWSLVAGVEWMTVMASVLAFSPETNSRHLVQTGLMNVLGLVLVVETRGPARWAAGAGLLVMWMGLNLPFGSRTQVAALNAVGYWHGIGGPAWAVLLAMGLLTWSCLTLAKSRQGRAEGGAAATGAG